MASGKPDVTVDRYFKGGTKALESELRAYMKHRLSGSILTPAELPAITVTLTPMDAVHTALAEDAMTLMVGLPKAKRTAFAGKVRADVAAFPYSAYAQSMLAETELDAGDLDAALTAADHAIALDPAQGRGWVVRAEVWLRRAQKSDLSADWKTALASIVKANRADTEDPVPLVQYFRWAAQQSVDVPQLAYDGLEKAFGMLPQNPGYRLMLASAYAHRKQYDTAISLLGPIAHSPHDSGMRTAALAMGAAFEKARQDAGAPGLMTEVLDDDEDSE